MKIFAPERWGLRRLAHLYFNARRAFGPRVRLVLEILEDRVVPAVSITQTGDLTPPASTSTGISLASGDLPPVPSNLGFEDLLSGWHTDPGNSGDVSVVTQFTARGGIDPNTEQAVPAFTFSPVEGHNFAVLTTGRTSSASELSRSFAVGQGGQIISLAAFFDAGDYLPFNDYGDIVLFKNDVPLATLFAASIHGGTGLDGNPVSPLLAPRPDGGNCARRRWVLQLFTLDHDSIPYHRAGELYTQGAGRQHR